MRQPKPSTELELITRRCGRTAQELIDLLWELGYRLRIPLENDFTKDWPKEWVVLEGKII